MKNPLARRRKRERTVSLCLFLLESEPNGLRIQDLQRLVCQAYRFRASSNTIGQYLKPLVDSGVLEKTWNGSGNAVYRYIPVEET